MPKDYSLEEQAKLKFRLLSFFLFLFCQKGERS